MRSVFVGLSIVTCATASSTNKEESTAPLEGDGTSEVVVRTRLKKRVALTVDVLASKSMDGETIKEPGSLSLEDAGVTRLNSVDPLLRSDIRSMTPEAIFELFIVPEEKKKALPGSPPDRTPEPPPQN